MSGYELLDSGLGRKLERIGRFRCVRQAPQAHWRPRLGEEAWQPYDQNGLLFANLNTPEDLALVQLQRQKPESTPHSPSNNGK